MRPLAACLAIALVGAALPAEAATRPVVLELFTSEGCSSCPPADAFLTTLAARQDVLPLAFHVTYWNALGWSDPYSMDAATSRQSMYAARLGGGAYTPEMVVDGRAAMVGSQREEVTAALEAARAQAGAAIDLSATASGRAVDVAIGKGQGRGRVMLIGFDPRHTTRIGRGENSGRTLVESNIVRSLQTIGSYDGSPATLHAERGDGLAAAVVVQGYDGRILAASRLSLP